MADSHSALAHLNVVLGSTLQIVPAGNLPLAHRKYHPGGRVAIVNLQPTKHDRKADLVIKDYVDRVMEKLLARLGLEVPEYKRDEDPVCRVGDQAALDPDFVLDWTQVWRGSLHRCFQIRSA